MEQSSVKFIYGAGNYGQILLGYFKNLGINIDYFVQTDEPENREIEGIPVISFKNMNKCQGYKLVFVAIANNKICYEIENNLYYQFGLENIKVYLFKNFIEENLLSKRNIFLYGTKKCIVCGNNVDKFLSYGINTELFENHHIIGGGYRKNVICPCCGAIDRIRWLYYVLVNKINIFKETGRVLHFAPENGISQLIQENKNIDYYTCDIVPGRAMHVIDITDIPYKDNTFECVICNHVLEHITNEKKAISEIKRILKPTGKWIFSFPICTDQKTYEDVRIISPEQRLKVYGQEDHVRLYGNDFIKHFENYGFILHIYTPKDELDLLKIEEYGFIEDDIIIVATIKNDE